MNYYITFLLHFEEYDAKRILVQSISSFDKQIESLFNNALSKGKHPHFSFIFFKYSPVKQSTIDLSPWQPLASWFSVWNDLVTLICFKIFRLYVPSPFSLIGSEQGLFTYISLFHWKSSCNIYLYLANCGQKQWADKI